MMYTAIEIVQFSPYGLMARVAARAIVVYGHGCQAKQGREWAAGNRGPACRRLDQKPKSLPPKWSASIQPCFCSTRRKHRTVSPNYEMGTRRATTFRARLPNGNSISAQAHANTELAESESDGWWPAIEHQPGKGFPAWDRVHGAIEEPDLL
jgi:hypothetical protein